MTLDQLGALVLRHTPGFGPGSARSIARAKAAIGEGAAAALYRRPEAEDIITAFRLILRRDPDPAQVQDFLRLPAVAAVARELFGAQEFRDWFAREHVTPRANPDAERARPALAYIHLPKTGGTSLRHALAQNFAPDRICPVWWNRLHTLSVAELGHYDFFQGHFDYSALRFIPRDDVKVISMFREPRARLISTWRALHSLRTPVTPGGELLPAQRMDIEEFYTDRDTRASADLHNYYLMAFGFSPSGIGGACPAGLSRSERAARMDEAKRNILSLTAFGLTERFDQSVKLIYKVLGLIAPETVTALNVTDEKPDRDPRHARIGPVTPTPKLHAALDELVEFDYELYRFAVAEFDYRCAQHGIA